MLFKLKADAEIDLLTSSEMKDLLTPQVNLLEAIRDLLESQAEHETLTLVQTFPIKIAATVGTFGAPVMRVPQGFAASLHSISIWTPPMLAAISGTVTEKFAAAGATVDQAAGPLVAVYGGTAGYGIGWTWGKAQSPYLRDGQSLYVIGKTTAAVSASGLCRVQYSLSPMQD